MRTLFLAIAVLFGTVVNAQTQSENYIKTTVYQTEVKEGQQHQVLESDQIQTVNYFDGLGRAKQSIAVRAGGQDSQTNILDWTDDWTVGTGSTPLFNKTGRTIDNKREFGSNPFGEQSLLWRCGNTTDVQTNAGWNSDHFDIDNKVGYLYTVWVKRTGSGSGTFYHGIWDVNYINGTNNGNPYFFAKKLPKANTWYLLVGRIYPHNYTGGNATISGIYDINGSKVVNGTDFKWKNTASSIRIRDFYYDANATNSYAYYWNPSITVVDNNAQQPIAKQIKNSKPKDIVTHFEYDDLGRQTKTYLPYASSRTQNGNIHTNALVATSNFYNTEKYEHTTNPYTEVLYDHSVFNRVLKQGAPGESWEINGTSSNDHTIKFGWSANTSENVIRYKVTFTNGNLEVPLLKQDGYYEQEELFVTTTKDENWQSSQQHKKDHTIDEFRDKLGRLILKRTFNNNVPHETYYVYDRFGNLTYVLPPKVTVHNGVSSTELNELCYQYKYDRRNRLVEKKIPGKGWEYIVYNKLDQPVMTQDAIQRPKREWLFTKYDAFGRVAYTGLHLNPGNVSRTTMQGFSDNGNYTQYVTRTSQYIDVANTNIYYSNDAIPTGINKVYTINYYDNYSFDRDGMNKPTSVYGVATNNSVKSLPTGTKVRVLGTNSWITTVIGYDAKGQVIWTGSRNDYLDTTDITETELDFTGKPITVKTTHTKGSNTPIVTIDSFTYDHMGRVLTQKQQINNQTQELIAQNVYDELGQLEQKKIGNAAQAPLQTVDYKYNVRGWLTDINDVNAIGNDLFSFKINYDTPTISRSKALYNGNICETHWKTANDNTLRNYKYSYDALNRITSASGTDGRFNVFNVGYDKNGNILGLLRNGAINEAATSFGVMDHLQYTYDVGNKLRKVQDTGNKSYGFKDGINTNDDYTYDINGNMTVDRNKKITNISYNHLNLPIRVDVTSKNPGESTYIDYVYDANGVKQQKIVNVHLVLSTFPFSAVRSIDKTEYAGNYIYKVPFIGAKELEFINTSEGYVEPQYEGIGNNRSVTGFDYIYQHKDHLGNIRLSYSDTDKDGKIDVLRNNIDVDGDGDNALEIREEKNYYPFGLVHKGYNYEVRGTKNNLKTYQGQEYTEDLGLNTHEWKYRISDPAIGRFWQIDPLAEEYAYNSTYAFQENKLGMGVELEGLEMVSERSKDGKSVTITYTVKPVNNSGGLLSSDQFNTLVDDRILLTQSSLSGETAEGQNLTVNVVTDKNATIVWEYNSDLDVDSEVGQILGDGHTDEIGNTQENRNQIDVYSVLQGENGSVTLTDENIKEASLTGAHEDGHVGGLHHPNDIQNKTLKNKVSTDPNNLMLRTPISSNVLPEQRSQIIQQVESQQK